MIPHDSKNYLPLDLYFFSTFYIRIEQEDDDDDQSDSEESKPVTKKPRWEKGHDVNENKTVFVRNLSFNSDEEDLRDMMEENFGKVLFAKFVIDRATERPKGTAFVKFASEESAKKCMEATVLTGANSAEGKIETESHMKNLYSIFNNDE